VSVQIVRKGGILDFHDLLNTAYTLKHPHGWVWHENTLCELFVEELFDPTLSARYRIICEKRLALRVVSGDTIPSLTEAQVVEECASESEFAIRDSVVDQDIDLGAGVFVVLRCFNAPPQVRCECEEAEHHSQDEPWMFEFDHIIRRLVVLAVLESTKREKSWELDHQIPVHTRTHTSPE
jgi:hypothetical protein